MSHSRWFIKELPLFFATYGHSEFNDIKTGMLIIRNIFLSTRRSLFCEFSHSLFNFRGQVLFSRAIVLDIGAFWRLGTSTNNFQYWETIIFHLSFDNMYTRLCALFLWLYNGFLMNSCTFVTSISMVVLLALMPVYGFLGANGVMLKNMSSICRNQIITKGTKTLTVCIFLGMYSA